MKKLYMLLTWMVIALLLCSCGDYDDTPIATQPSATVTPTVHPTIVPTVTPAPTPSPALPDSSFGMTAKEFVQRYNAKASDLDASIVAEVPTYTDSYIDVKTSTSNVTLSLALSSGYVTDVYVSGKGDGTTTSALQQMYAMVAAAQAIDSSLQTSDASNFLTQLIHSAPTNGDNYSQEKNGIKYTISAYPGDTLLSMVKAQ